MSIGGHYRTLGGYVKRRFSAMERAGSRPWETSLADARVGPVRLTGRLKEVPGARALVVIIHGLGGCSDSPYAIAAAGAADALRLSSLRLSLRGADRRGEDFYHGGLTDDLRAAAASTELRTYRHLLLLGYSLGGHVALRFAAEGVELRLRAVAAVCPPLDLSIGATALDRPSRWIYRRHVLRNLKEIYQAVASRKDVPRSFEEVRQIHSLREMDGATVAPRYGFASAEDYYETASVGPLLDRLTLPSLLVAAEDDPVVPPEAIRPYLSNAAPELDVRWVPSGGHLGFSSDLDLGLDGARGLENQLLAWLASRLPSN